MARYALARSEGTIGELARLLTEAAVAAVDSGEEAIPLPEIEAPGWADAPRYDLA